MTGAVVIGTGFGCFTHVRALRAAGFDVPALVGRDPAKTEKRARMFDIPRHLTSVGEALRLDGVDAVTIATPPHTHADIALAAIDAGKHVLCEKPFARDAGEGRAVLAAAEGAEVVHLLGCEFRWDPGQATLARAVAAGQVGEPKVATFILHVPLLADPSAEVPEWWADSEQGGGWLGAHGSQVIDQIRVTLGEFDSVCASLPHVAERGMTAEDAFVVHFRMRSARWARCRARRGTSAPIAITRVVGSQGTAWIDGVGATVKVADGRGPAPCRCRTDLPTGTGPRLPDGLVTTAYERMISHGLGLLPLHPPGRRYLRCRIGGSARPAGASRRRLRRRGSADGCGGRRSAPRPPGGRGSTSTGA